MAIETTLRGTLALIEFENPPVNALSIDFAIQLSEEIARWQQDSRVEALILTGKGRFFSAGADIGEFDHNPVALIKALQGLNQQLNQCQKLVVMAMHGAALGGGLELALSAHARIAAPETKIGLPEIHLGLLPGAGGTQALPRLIGIEKAYEMMTHGRPLMADEAKEWGVIDAISGDNLIEDAFTLARNFLHQQTLPSKPYDRQIPPEQTELIKIYRRLLPLTQGAKTASCQAILDCLQAAIELPFADGLHFEVKKFHQLLGSYAARALRYGFFASKAAVSLPASQAEEIGNRLMTALSQEAEKLLNEGVARNQADIDAIMVKNYGFSPEAGGPLFWLKEHKNDDK